MAHVIRRPGGRHECLSAITPRMGSSALRWASHYQATVCRRLVLLAERFARHEGVRNTRRVGDGGGFPVILFRYLRLTPLYFFVLLFWWKALQSWASARSGSAKGGHQGASGTGGRTCSTSTTWYCSRTRLPSSARPPGTWATICSFLSSCLCLSWRLQPAGGLCVLIRRVLGLDHLLLWGADRPWSAGVDGPPPGPLLLAALDAHPPYLVGSATALLLNDVRRPRLGQYVKR